MDLFEREEQLRTLAAALDAVRAGEGRVVLISGEAGIGKTSLAKHFTAQHAGRIAAYWGACDSLFTPRPLGPFSDIALQMRPALLGAIVASPNWHRAATAFLQELNSRGSPVVLVVEDIHWADEGTLDMLKFLGRRVQNSRVLLILTFRDDEPTARRFLAPLIGDLPARTTVRLVLSPLSQGAVDQMAQRAQRQTEGLFAATGGNPFFVTEMLESEPGAVPASVRDLVLARVSRLSPPARGVAELAALVPGGAELWLFDRIFPKPALAIDECVEQGVLRGDQGSLGFRHDLARRAVEDAVPPGRAREFHGQILHALLEHNTEAVSLARIVHHAAHAGDFAVLQRYAPEAARQASRLGAHREAAAHYQIVLNQLFSLAPEVRAELLEGRSFECYLTGEISTAFQARLQAAAIWKSLQRAGKEGDNLRWLSRLAWFGGKRKEAERFAQDAVEILEKLPPGPELAMAYSNKSQLHTLSEEVAQARYWGERAIELAERLEATEILVHALVNVGTAELLAGEEQGWDHLTQALSMARENELHDHVGRAYANLSSVSVQSRRYAEAAAEAWRGLGCPFELALALSAGDSGGQIEALRIFEQLGARPVAEMLKNDLRQHGVKGIPRGPRPATRHNPAGMTNRELEVLDLLAEGLSNAEIAARLSISKKTVDHHVSALLGKLEAGTRSQALAIARRQGLLP